MFFSLLGYVGSHFLLSWLIEGWSWYMCVFLRMQLIIVFDHVNNTYPSLKHSSFTVRHSPPSHIYAVIFIYHTLWDHCKETGIGCDVIRRDSWNLSSMPIWLWLIGCFSFLWWWCMKWGCLYKHQFEEIQKPHLHDCFHLGFVLFSFSFSMSLSQPLV